MRFMMPIGGCCRWPYPELPAGEVQGRTSESRREELPHLLSASGGRRGRAASPAGLGERCQALQLPKPSVCLSHMRTQEHNSVKNTCYVCFPTTGPVCQCVLHKRQKRLENGEKCSANHQHRRHWHERELRKVTVGRCFARSHSRPHSLCSICLGSSPASSTWGTCSLAPTVKTVRSWMTKHSWTGSPT